MSALVSPLPASRFTNICVYCGSSPGVRPEYTAGAEALGKELVRRNVGLVYGGGNVGLMGAVSRTVRELGGRVLGIIPLELAPVEITGSCVGQETTVVPDMHTRKALMASRADAFIALPGGFGTFEELLEVVTWQQLGFSSKPVGVLNIAGFYDPLLAFVEQAYAEGFIKEAGRRIIVSSDNPCELLDELERYQLPKSLIELKREQAANADADKFM